MRVTIDGMGIEVSEGTTALEALRLAGLDIPTACHDPRLEPTGACRICLIKLKGTNRPVTACALKLQEGMELEVDTPEMGEVRREEVALLARSYPEHSYGQAPEKEFNRWLESYGLVARTSRPSGEIDETSMPQVDDSNPYFRFDPDACIKCYRCVRICDEVQGANVWQVMGRSSETHVIPDSMGLLIDSSCVSCGACVDACPTSALVDKTRLKEGEPTDWTRTTCPYCGVGCELNVGTIGNRIVQVLPILDAPVNKGHLCVKGRYAHQFVHAEDRVTKPMIRRPAGEGEASASQLAFANEWVTVTWDEAIAFVASELARIKAKYGPNSIGVLGSARAPNEDNYLAQKFARVVLGTNNVDCCARVCHGPTAAAMKVMLGTGAATNSYDDLELAKTIMVVGSNSTENHPIVGERIRQTLKRGTKLVVIDPRRIPLAAEATVHLQLRPGTNVPLLNAMAHVIFAEGLADEEFLSTRTNEAEEFREFVKEWTPERAASICGVEAEDIRKAARIYATNKPSMCFHGLGVTEHLQGTEGVMCLTNLALITGNMGKAGSGINPLRGQNNVQGSAHMGCEPSNLTGFVSIADGRERFEKVWQAHIPEFPGLNLMQMLEAADRGEFKALWAIGYDVYFTNASAERTRRQFEQMELVVVQDLFLNETAKEFAHVFLPACSSFERDGTFMNAERRVQRVRPAIDPVGDSKPDWEIVQLVANEMERLAKASPSSRFSFASAEEIWEEVRKVWTPGGGMSYSRLDHEGLQWPCPTEDHPGTQILHREKFPIGERALLKRIDYTPTPEITSPEFPFLLTTGRTLFHFNAGTMTNRTRNKVLRPSDTLDIHPDDACSLEIVDGDRVTVRSHYGEATLPARLDRRMRRGELFATFHSPEVFLNLLTGPTKDRVVGAPEYKVTAVQLEKALASLSLGE